MPVVALLAPKVDGSFGEVSVLSDILVLPDDIYFFIKNRVPSFKMKYSKMAGHKYLGNTCPSCGLLSGEFFLHSEPGAPFFPEDEEDAKSLYLLEIPLQDSVKIMASPSTGSGELILEHATKLK